MSDLPFLAIGFVTTLLALLVVSARNLLVAAVCLMALLATTAAAYALLGAGLLAAMQILVYVAGTVVVIVFAIMLTQSQEIEERAPSPLRRLTAAVASASFIAVTTAALSSGQLKLAEPAAPAAGSDAAAIGRLLLSAGPEGYVLPLEVISLLLLAVMIGGIALAGARTRRPDAAAAPLQETARGATDDAARVAQEEAAKLVEEEAAKVPSEATS